MDLSPGKFLSRPLNPLDLSNAPLLYRSYVRYLSRMVVYRQQKRRLVSALSQTSKVA